MTIRVRLLLAALATVVLGLLSRSAWSPAFVVAYAGDALYAVMVYFLVAFVFPRRSAWWVAVVAAGVSYAIEVSQLAHTPWLDALRATRAGRLVLGVGFSWSDMVCYSVGAPLAGLVDRLVVRRRALAR